MVILLPRLLETINGWSGGCTCNVKMHADRDYRGFIKVIQRSYLQPARDLFPVPEGPQDYTFPAPLSNSHSPTTSKPKPLSLMANTLVGLITTVFTPPASCLEVITLGADQDYFQESFSLFIGNFNGQYRDKNYLSAAKGCYPTPTSAIDYWANYYYSPAYCPTGYLPACRYTAGDPPLATSVTASLCCASYV